MSDWVHDILHLQSPLKWCWCLLDTIMLACEVFAPSILLTIITMIHLVLLYNRRLSLCASWPGGDPSVSKWQIFNYKNKQTTPRTCVLVYCNEGDTSMKRMLSSEYWEREISSSQFLSFTALAVQSNHHYCKLGNPICRNCFDPSMSLRQWIYMYLK